jgi:hypothetical protein
MIFISSSTRSFFEDTARLPERLLAKTTELGFCSTLRCWSPLELCSG